MSKQKQAREIAERERKRRSQVLTIAIAAVTLVVVLIIAYLLFFAGQGPAPGAPPGHLWSLDSAGLLTFADRGPNTFNIMINREDKPGYYLSEVTFESFNDSVYALLRVPKNVSRPPVVIVLPAASVNKEADSAMAEALCSWGYASLTLDERGNNGSTPGPSPMDLDSGYGAFTGGGDPVQYKQVYDVLRGYDCIRSEADLDSDNVAVLGESMGGRFAIISAALEPGLKAAIGISTGPYGLAGNDDASRRFLKSIEPAGYLSQLPPRKVIFFHFAGDPIIPVSLDRQLYDAASQPKAWHQYNGTVHGVYSDVYAPDLHEELRSVFGQ
ncbi:MAG TPA: acetylxylan esterase [Methanocella sp.]|nr:acetylxylan esterase [Methanocella sp.]